MDLQNKIEDAFERTEKKDLSEDLFATFEKFKKELNSGRIRAAEKRGNKWIVNTWVKKGILVGFRIGAMRKLSVDDKFIFYDKSTFPLKSILKRDGVRIVPGGSSIRDGCFMGRGVTCMPPMYVNVGAYVDDGTMIDSHALVGSCAQVGKRVHLSACAQVGGVLEPIGSMPVIIEDDVLVGGNCGIYEGTIVRKGAVLGAGTILTASTPVYDVVRDEMYKKTPQNPLEIPENAVVVPGSRPLTRGRGEELGLSIYAPIIVKYRDEKTDSTVQLEDSLR